MDGLVRNPFPACDAHLLLMKNCSIWSAMTHLFHVFISHICLSIFVPLPSPLLDMFRGWNITNLTGEAAEWMEKALIFHWPSWDIHFWVLVLDINLFTYQGLLLILLVKLVYKIRRFAKILISEQCWLCMAERPFITSDVKCLLIGVMDRNVSFQFFISLI